MKVVRAVPTETISEKLSVQRLSEALGVRHLRANVFTLAEGSMSRHMHREQEELYLVLDGRAMIDVDGEQLMVGRAGGGRRAGSRLAPGDERGSGAAHLLRGSGTSGGGRRRGRRLRTAGRSAYSSTHSRITASSGQASSARSTAAQSVS